MEAMRKEYSEQTPKLQHYGNIFGDWFVDSTSKLYPAQQSALESLEKWFSDEDTKDCTAVVVMPTGSGKTGVICCLPYFIGRAIYNGKIRGKETDKQPVLIVAPGLGILDQLKENLALLDDSEDAEQKPFLMRPELKLLNAKDHKKGYYKVFAVKRVADVNNLEKLQKKNEYDIVLSNSQKWRKKNGTPMYADLPDDFFSMVIVDEAHHLPAPQWSDIVNKFKRHARVIFFTATPHRADEKEITTDRAISATKDSKLKFAYHLTREEAIESKLIRDVQMFVLQEDIIYPLQNVVKGTPAKPVKKKDTPYDVWRYAEEVLIRVKRRIDEKNSTLLPGDVKHAAIVITKDIKDATHIRDFCTGTKGHLLHIPQEKVGLVHSAKIKDDKNKRKEVMDNIKSHQYEIVIFVKMLLEGFDYKPFSVAGIVTTIQSPVKFAHFIGRIQRIVRHRGEDGKEEVEEGIKGDIITHQYFRQEQLFEKYQQPPITEEENKEIDEDSEEDNSQNGLPAEN